MLIDSLLFSHSALQAVVVIFLLFLFRATLG